MRIRGAYGLGLAIVLCACTSKNDLLGVWSNGQEKITFLEDKVALIEGQQTIQLTWRQIENNRFIMTGSGFGQVTITGCMDPGLLKLKVPNQLRGGYNFAFYYRLNKDGTLKTVPAKMEQGCVP
jgi:hypothetical protein